MSVPAAGPPLYHKNSRVSRTFFKNFFTLFLDLAGLALYNYIHTKEKEMKQAKETKVARPTKKVLINEIIAKGVDPKIAQSLSRANIEALQMVKELLS